KLQDRLGWDGRGGRAGLCEKSVRFHPAAGNTMKKKLSPPRTAVMAAPTHRLLRHLRRMVAAADTDPASDAALLDHFVRERDEDAFAALVARHGPMVQGVCRRVLHDTHHAEDAFQATFLVLARKAATVRPRGRQDALCARPGCPRSPGARRW